MEVGSTVSLSGSGLHGTDSPTQTTANTTDLLQNGIAVVREQLHSSSLVSSSCHISHNLHTSLNQVEKSSINIMQRLLEGNLSGVRHQLGTLDEKLNRLSQMLEEHMFPAEPSRAKNILKGIATIAAIVVVTAAAVGAVASPFGLVVGAVGLAYLISKCTSESHHADDASRYFNATPWKRELSDLKRSFDELNRKIEALEQSRGPHDVQSGHSPSREPLAVVDSQEAQLEQRPNSRDVEFPLENRRDSSSSRFDSSFTSRQPARHDRPPFSPRKNSDRWIDMDDLSKKTA